MTVLVNREVEEELARGNIIIDPFNQDQLNNTSYNVRFGRYIARLREDIEQITVGADASDLFEIEDLGESGVLTLGPGERCLAHTEEFIGGKDVIVTEMRARSSWGRWGLQACGCAGWGDVGYFNRYTAEVINLNKVPLTFEVGTCFAQIVFHRVSRPTEGTQYHERGYYQTSADLKVLRETWRPEMMLPRQLQPAQRANQS